MVVLRKLLDGLRCFAPLSILRGFVIIWAWAVEDGIRVAASVMADFLVGAVCL